MTVLPDTEIFEAARKAHFAVTLHSPADFEGMRRAGRLAAEVLDLLVPLVKPGVTTAALDKVAYDYIVAHGAIPACLGYRGYRHTVCTSINHVVCHGIPNDKPLRDGDIVNIDVTVILDGWHGDTSRACIRWATSSCKAERLIDITYESMMRGIAAVKPGATTGDIGHAIQSYAEGQERCAVVRDFCGHGLGTDFPCPAQHRALRQAGPRHGAEARHVLHHRADDQSGRLWREGAERRLDRGDARPFAVGAIRTFGGRDGEWRRNLHPLAQRLGTSRPISERSVRGAALRRRLANSR